MEITAGVFPFLMIMLFTLFAAGVTLDHDHQQRRRPGRGRPTHSASPNLDLADRR